jgi:hypothetical protein
VAGVTGPVLGMLEDVEQMALRHAGAHFLFKPGQLGGLLRRRQLLQVGCSVSIDAELGVGWESGVDRSALSAAAKSSPRSGMPRAAQ